jgi:hypothetical protein
MARINTYSQDNNVTKNDKVIGSDSGGETRNYKLEDIAGFLNTSSLINVNGQLVYQFKNQGTPGAGEFTLSGGGVNNFNVITSAIFSYINRNAQSVQSFLNSLNGNDIMIAQADNPGNYGIFAVTNLTAGGEGEEYSTFTLSFKEGNGGLLADSYYNLSTSPKTGADKNFVSNDITFTANVGKTVNHNLGKNPTVILVDSAGTEVVADIQHNSTTQITVTTTSSFTGKIFAN